MPQVKHQKGTPAVNPAEVPPAISQSSCVFIWFMLLLLIVYAFIKCLLCAISCCVPSLGRPGWTEDPGFWKLEGEADTK